MKGGVFLADKKTLDGCIEQFIKDAIREKRLCRIKGLTLRQYILDAQTRNGCSIAEFSAVNMNHLLRRFYNHPSGRSGCFWLELERLLALLQKVGTPQQAEHLKQLGLQIDWAQAAAGDVQLVTPKEFLLLQEGIEPQQRQLAFILSACWLGLETSDDPLRCMLLKAHQVHNGIFELEGCIGQFVRYRPAPALYKLARASIVHADGNRQSDLVVDLSLPQDAQLKVPADVYGGCLAAGMFRQARRMKARASLEQLVSKAGLNREIRCRDLVLSGLFNAILQQSANLNLPWRQFVSDPRLFKTIEKQYVLFWDALYLPDHLSLTADCLMADYGFAIDILERRLQAGC